MILNVINDFLIIKKFILEVSNMTKEMQISMLESRLNKIKARPDAFQSPGSMRKTQRKIRNLTQSGQQ